MTGPISLTLDPQQILSVLLEDGTWYRLDESPIPPYFAQLHSRAAGAPASSASDPILLVWGSQRLHQNYAVPLSGIRAMRFQAKSPR